MDGRIGTMQIGKNGVTKNLIETLKSFFKNRHIVKITVLKSAGRDREKIKNISENILSELGKNYTSRIIGFTIVVRKWRKPMR
jgi:RNA-binding protein YhbY